MMVYAVICNGKLSSDGYETLEQAQRFCETRAGSPQKTGNGWIYKNGNDLYVIQDIKVEVKDD